MKDEAEDQMSRLPLHVQVCPKEALRSYPFIGSFALSYLRVFFQEDISLDYLMHWTDTQGDSMVCMICEWYPKLQQLTSSGVTPWDS